MIVEQFLRQGLQKLLQDTESAVRERLSDEPTLATTLRERHAAAVRAERTEGSVTGYNAFADEAITQAAVHWLLGCVFVRFLEDNGWLDERNAKVAWIAGPADRLLIAKDRRTLFLRPDPNLTDRDYLLHVFAEVTKLPGVSGLFDQKHNPLYMLQPTAHGAAKIVEFFQEVNPDSNDLIHDFTDPAHDTYDPTGRARDPGPSITVWVESNRPVRQLEFPAPEPVRLAAIGLQKPGKTPFSGA